MKEKMVEPNGLRHTFSRQLYLEVNAEGNFKMETTYYFLSQISLPIPIITVSFPREISTQSLLF